ncbi:MAG TPA: STAS domain-containing protein [Acidimicrobiia bacterium]
MVSDEVGRGPVPTTIEVLSEAEAGGTSATVVIRGEIDVATSPRLRSTITALLAEGVAGLTIDFSGVSFIDSSGLGVLVGALKRVRETPGGSLQVVGATDFVRKIFEITGLHTLFLVDD